MQPIWAPMFKNFKPLSWFLGTVHTLEFWVWRDREACHGTILCCQHVDRANCNNIAARHPHTGPLHTND